MADRIDQQNERNLLSILVAECPTSLEQAASAKLYNDLVRAGENHKSIMRSLTGALYDGLAYGNWPTEHKIVPGTTRSRLAPWSKKKR
jgi:hypothetical protein